MTSPGGALTAEELVTAFDHAPIGLAVLTPSGVITACNGAMGALLRLDARGLVGGTFFDHTHPDDLDGARASCALMQDGRTRIVRHECRFVRSDGAVLWVRISTSRVPASPIRPAHLIMHIEDVSERKALEAELSHRALHDLLTGLANRTLLADRIHRAVQRGGDGSRPGHLFYLDLDGFKAVNDRFGHAAGDAVLVELARRLAGLIGPEDTAARLGGDEFAVLCPVLDPADVDRVARAFRAAAAEPFAVAGSSVALTAAVGWVPVLATGADRRSVVARLLEQADLRMYATKPSRSRRAVPDPI